MRWCAIRKEARYYETLEEGAVKCTLCPHLCLIRPGKVGICRARENVDGRLEYLHYAGVSSLALDPVEKKPLFHFYPGTTVLSFGGVGCIGLAYTYNEPTVGFEFVYDTAKLARKAGLKNVMVTNGEIEEAPRKELLPLIDAWNIDVKAFDPDTYRKMCGGPLETVLETVKAAAGTSHVELTNLLIPGKNDDEDQIRRMVDWIADNVGEDTPLHFSRYFPRYEYHEPETPSATLRTARSLALKRLHYVYIGNAPELEGEDTLCPRCGQVVILRHGYRVENRLEGRKCPNCGYQVAVVG